MQKNTIKNITGSRNLTRLKVTSINEPEMSFRNEIDIFIYNYLRDNGPITRDALSKKTGIPRSTLYDSLLRLILKKMVIKYSEDRKIRGRPKVYYKII